MAGPGFATQSSTLAQLALDLPVFPAYKPLDPRKREIRLLSITSSDLECHLYHASLDDQPSYSALSYYWGAPGATRSVVINGIELQIRKTLHQFIKALYRRCGPLTVWLDVLCINQHDLAEQGAQVAMMGDIYSKAERVYAWLGKGDADTDFAIAALQQSNSELWSSFVRRRVLAGVKQLFLRQFWTRVWIVQECLVNDLLVLACGTMMINFDELFEAIRSLAAIPRIDSFFENDPGNLLNDGQDDKLASARMAQIASGRRSRKAKMKEPLIAWMASFASSGCQEPRDRFYGFRALASDGYLFHVDYTSNTVDMLLQALSTHNRLHFTRWCKAHPAKRDARKPAIDLSRSEKPSWWTCPVPANAGPYRHDFKRGLLYDGLCVCEGLQLSKNESLQGLADSDADWIVLPVELYHPPDDVLAVIDDTRRLCLNPGLDKIWGFDSARLAWLSAACNYSQQPGTTRYWIFEQGDDLESGNNFGDWIFVDIDARGATASCTIFSGPAWAELVHYHFLTKGGRGRSADDPLTFDEIDAPVNYDPTLWPQTQEQPECLALLETFEAIANGHVWACHVTKAVHISRFLLFVLMALQNSIWSSIPAHLIDFGRRFRPSERRTCRCVMPEGMVSPSPPPWTNAMQE